MRASKGSRAWATAFSRAAWMTSSPNFCGMCYGQLMSQAVMRNTIARSGRAL